jgi:inosine/xanthosine triphosphatase
MIFFVGSTNPAKLKAAEDAIKWKWPTAQVTGIEVPSGVAAQPMSDKETRTGAETRAKNALQYGLVELQNQGHTQPEEALGIGLEGGVFSQGKELWNTVWVAVADTSGRTWSVNGSRFKLPSILATRIKAGEEMGPVVEQVVGELGVPKKQGMIGVVTKEFVVRGEEYRNITKLAIGLWFGRHWQKEK